MREHFGFASHDVMNEGIYKQVSTSHIRERGRDSRE